MVSDNLGGQKKQLPIKKLDRTCILLMPTVLVISGISLAESRIEGEIIAAVLSVKLNAMLEPVKYGVSYIAS